MSAFQSDASNASSVESDCEESDLSRTQDDIQMFKIELQKDAFPDQKQGCTQSWTHFQSGTLEAKCTPKVHSIQFIVSFTACMEGGDAHRDG